MVKTGDSVNGYLKTGKKCEGPLTRMSEGLDY